MNQTIMKKSMAVILILAMTFVFSISTINANAATKEKTLTSTMKYLYKGAKDLPKLGNTKLTSENFESYAFIKKGKGYYGLASEAMIGSIAHSVVLVRVPKGVSAKSVAKKIKANANPRKWICVEAEKVTVKYHKKTVLLIMTNAKDAKKIAKNFDKLYD
ncbi:MAG: hypothetical protein RR313_07175 [Anaerovoracaceae bacterium]